MLGPVFRAELLTTARRRRYYVLRALFGLVLLAILVVQYVAWFQDPRLLFLGGTAPIALVHGFTQAMFHDYVVAQAVAVVFLTPALLAGVIAEEKHRKTLLYLMASQLSSGEIVLGKLAARMLHVAIFLTLGLPILALLSLFGGVDPAAVSLAFFATAATAYFLGGLTILASTLSLRPRGAILLSYALLLLWPIAPALGAILSRIWPGTFDPWLLIALEWAYPGQGLLMALERSAWRSATLLPQVAWTALLELIYGSLFVAIAAWRLRPISRTQEGKPRWEIRLDNQGRRRWQLRARPPCGNAPMLWKEYYAARIGGVARLLVLLSGLTLVVFAGCLLAEPAYNALVELRRSGYEAVATGRGRSELNDGIRALTWITCVVWVIGAAVTAAGSVSGEREGDTWISLVSTLLDGGEILRAKAIGSIVRFRVLLWLLIALWGLGLLTGALHPVGVAVAGTALAAFLGFAAMLGTYLSLRSGSTLRAMMIALTVLLVANGAYWFVPWQPWWFYHLRLSNMPQVVSQALLSYPEAETLFRGQAPIYWPQGPQMWWFSLNWEQQLRFTYDGLWVVLPLYLASTLVLYGRAALAFDRVVDRPRRTILLDVSTRPARGPVAAKEAFEGT